MCVEVPYIYLSHFREVTPPIQPYDHETPPSSDCEDDGEEPLPPPLPLVIPRVILKPLPRLAHLRSSSLSTIASEEDEDEDEDEEDDFSSSSNSSASSSRRRRWVILREEVELGEEIGKGR